MKFRSPPVTLFEVKLLSARICRILALPQHFRGSVGSGEPCLALEQKEVRAAQRAAAGRPCPCLLLRGARAGGRGARVFPFMFCVLLKHTFTLQPGSSGTGV